MEIHDTALDDEGKEFILMSTSRSFTLSAESTQMRDEWVVEICSAINKFHRCPAIKLSEIINTRLGQLVLIQNWLKEKDSCIKINCFK